MRPRKTLADYMIIGISPALIILLICSLIFFLMTVVYHGQYPTRLSIIVFLFIMAAVLITRISIEEGTEYAGLFAIPLAVVTMLAMARFVRVPGITSTVTMLINIGLMALTWWSAHKLTWNCTLIDEKEDASGEGLLQIMGVDQETSGAADTGGIPQTAKVESSQPKTAETSSSKPTIPLRQWFRNRMNRKRKKPGVPGVWVVYFSLAALPLFGIGQLFIPVSAANERRIAFFMICTYAGSALGLLLTTSFLGLRRYLRQRRLPMPIDMAATWLVIGALLIGLVLVGAVLLPRPGAAVAISQLPFSFDSPDDNKPSRFGWGKEGAEPQQPDSSQPKPSISQPRPPRPPRPPREPPPTTGPSGQTQSGERASGSDQNQAGSGKQSGGQEQSGKMREPTSRPRSQHNDHSNANRSDPQNAPANQNSTENRQPPGQKPDSQTRQAGRSRSSGSQAGKTQDRPASNRRPPADGKQQPRQQSDATRSDSQASNQKPASSKSGSKNNEPGANRQQTSPRQNDTSPSDMQRGNSKSGNRTPAQDQRRPNQSRQQPNKKQPESGNGSQSDNTRPPGKQTKPQDDQSKSERDSSHSTGDRQSKQSPQRHQTTPSNQGSGSRGQSQDRKKKQPKSDDGTAQQDRDKNSQKQADQQPPKQDQKTTPPSQSFDLGRMLQSLLGGLGKLIKLVFLIALLALVGFLAWKYRDTIRQAIAQLLDDLRRLWQRLFGGGRPAGSGQQDADQLVDQPVRSFSSYSNPFSNGTAESIAPEKLVRYTFEALQAWAIQRQCPRAAEQTPLEFADQLAHQFPELGSETLLLADLYSRVAYGRQRVSSRRREPLRRLWRQMVATAESKPVRDRKVRGVPQ